MENAANALQLAFGMIIGVLLISLLVFLFRNISVFETSKRELEITRETTEFNKQFLAFDKTSMYGTDVISALGLAISNNKIQYQSKVSNIDRASYSGKYRPDLDFSVNIEIVFDEPIYVRTKRTVKKVTDSSGDLEIETDIDVAMNNGLDPRGPRRNPQETKTEIFKATKYSLADEDCYDRLEDIAVNSGGVITKTLTKGRHHFLEIEEDQYGLNDFKHKIYKCETVGTNDVGRVVYMKFVPVKNN